MTAFLETANYARTGECFGIDEIVAHLLNSDVILALDAGGIWENARGLVFALLGWQTMLYSPSFGTCPPQQLAIADVLDGFTGQAFMAYKQDQASAKHSLSDFLLGFGVMLPRENTCIGDKVEDRQAFESLTIIDPGEFNGYLLESIAKIRIKWVDVLAPHLEFDTATNTLFLFRYPSFCVANIPSYGDISSRGVIHSCASYNGCSTEWASEADVTQLLQEILLSYRLLFGQSRQSRRLFRSMDPFEGLPPEGHDPLLSLLCGGRKCMDSLAFAQDQAFYRPLRDFPVLRSRIASLHHQMSRMKPRGWRELWRDKRDSTQWFTFWAVIIIGGSGILLSLIQVILQAVQLAGAR
ncbi:hypothetical protein FGG08_001140 [Glutinoglossum americanum]|uniref:Uncharacterized protein n=1 Tax=Glutinoglossum americanum TaxID=1670608 RepID=A0A9P8IC53_9PEZI|nr:hypothetical protein FGG08_001140 [Glutinoglossum americanum]